MLIHAQIELVIVAIDRAQVAGVARSMIARTVVDHFAQVLDRLAVDDSVRAFVTVRTLVPSPSTTARRSFDQYRAR